VKDRVALEIIQEAFQDGRLVPGGLITEGTVGSTGVSLAMVAAAYGCRCFIAMPDDAAIEKSQMLEALGAEVERLRPVSIAHPSHFVNVARRRAASEPNALFADQFENPANFRAHLLTGQEIWAQSGGKVDAFVSGAGTGGTIAGVSAALKQRNSRIKVYLVDPPGSGLYNRVTRGVMYTSEEAEGKRLKHPFDTITEGVGINRLTANFAKAKVDGAFKASDKESVEMAQYLMRNEGLFVGSSAAVNCVGAVKLARKLGPGHVIVTVLCDGGHRHLSKFHNKEYLEKHGLTPTHTGRDLEFINFDNDGASGRE
jgi:cysteine synthase A